jgi:putative DNA primase/helicase
MIVGFPAMMKSPMLAEVMRPLEAMEAKAGKIYQRDLAEYELRTEALQAQRREVTAKASRLGTSTDNLIDELRQMRAEPPTRTRYVVADPTVEKLGIILNENPAGVLLFRDELVGFLATMDRAGHENDRSFYLQAWNGTSRYTYDRVGRGTLDIEAACVSILGATTPGPVQAYLREAFSGMRDDGLIQRFQVSVYPDAPAVWRNVDRDPDVSAR